jgi:bisphosphoglycerate-independent phosphoglycerate mutase (AlkP superfamily)
MVATPRPRAVRRTWPSWSRSEASGAKIATVIGRYYAMDRDKRWERNKLAWDAIVLGRGEVRTDRRSAAVRLRIRATRVAMSSCSP